MLFGERRSERRDHIADTCFVARDGVGISLDHHRPRIGDDMLLRPVETVEVALLVKDGGFGRVEIFRLAVPITRPPKAMQRPRSSKMGNITR